MKTVRTGMKNRFRFFFVPGMHGVAFEIAAIIKGFICATAIVLVGSQIGPIFDTLGESISGTLLSMLL